MVPLTGLSSPFYHPRSEVGRDPGVWGGRERQREGTKPLSQPAKYFSLQLHVDLGFPTDREPWLELTYR